MKEDKINNKINDSIRVLCLMDKNAYYHINTRYLKQGTTLKKNILDILILPYIMKKSTKLTSSITVMITIILYYSI